MLKANTGVESLTQNSTRCGLTDALKLAEKNPCKGVDCIPLQWH